MADFHIMNLDNLNVKSKLEKENVYWQENVTGINRLIRGCQREYDRLSGLFEKSKVVESVSTAFGVISALTLLPSEVQTEEAVDLISTPAGKVVLGVAVGGFAVAGLSNYISNRIYDKMKITQEKEDMYQDELAINEEILTANENTQAINQLRTAIYGEEAIHTEDSKFGFSEDGVTPSSDTGKLPKIIVIDNTQDFPTFDDDFSQ